MRVKQVDKCQFFMTITESELLIVEGYAKLFNMTIQESALVMCVGGWNSFGKKMMEYSRNVQLKPVGQQGHKLLRNTEVLLQKSDECVNFTKSMSDVMLAIARSANAKTIEEP